MTTLFDTLFIKRFCLPFDADITSYNNNISSCLCGNFNHASCILKGKERQFEKD